jgi:L-iditol 2-dehydrogenase
MKVVKGRKILDFKIFEEEKLSPGFDEVLIKVIYCGICGTDMHIVQLESEYTAIGHEISGEIMEKGPNVKEYEVGDMVSVHSSIPCGECDTCKNRFPLMCAIGGMGFATPCNGFSEYVTIDKRWVEKSRGISALEMSLVEPLDVALEAVFTTGVSLGDKVVIFGPGPLGLMMSKLSKISGASRVYLTGRTSDKGRLRAGIEEFGADEVFCVDDVEPVSAIKKLHPEGVNKVIITAHPSLLDDAVELAGFGGIITILAIAPEKVTFDINKLHYKKQQLRGAQPNPNAYFPMCMNLLREGVIDAQKVITHIFHGAEEVEKAFKLVNSLQDGVIKAVVKM